MKRIQFAYMKIPNMGDLLNELLMERVFKAEYVNTTRVSDFEITGIGSFLDSLFGGPMTRGNGIKSELRHFLYMHTYTHCNTWGTGFITDVSDKMTGLSRNNVHFMAVRGNKSKVCIEKILNKKIDPVLGDGGILASMLFDKSIEKKCPIGIIPHFKEQGCTEMNFILRKYPNAKVINLKDEPMKVIREIAECDVILSSSLHGLIVADSFGIPNIRVYFTDSPMGDGFKFDDYYSAYGIINPAKKIACEEDVPTINGIIDNYRITEPMVNRMKNDMYNSLDKYIKSR